MNNTGLLIHYPLNDDISAFNNIADCSGNKNNGTITGTINRSVDTIKYSRCISNTSSSYILSPSCLGSLNTGNFTLSIWIKPTQQDTVGQTAMLSLGNVANCGLCIETSRVFSYNSAGSSFVVNNIGLSNNTWAQVTVVRNGNTITVYKNGASIGSCSPGATLANTSILKIGGRYGSGNGIAYFSDLRIYNKALSANEVLALYNTPIAIASNGYLYTNGEFIESSSNVSFKRSGSITATTFNETGTIMKIMNNKVINAPSIIEY